MADDTAEHANDLEALVPQRFGKLSEAEKRLLRAAPKGEGAMCGPNFDDKDPANDPAKAEHGWGPEREIRAGLVRWLCIDPRASKMVDPRGILVHAAKVTDNLDLSFAT